MKLLISPTNAAEAKEAIAGGADIIDVKNPKEGAMGANYPWVIREIKAVTPKNLKVSCTIGEVPNLLGSLTLAACGAASLGVDYLKVGLQGVKTPQDAISLLKAVNRAAKECNPNIKVVAAGYGDAKILGAVDPMLIPEIAHKADVDVAMLDTATKDGKNLFDYMTVEQLHRFVESAHGLGLQVAFAGSLQKQDLPVVYGLGADIAGLRGAACTNSDRVDGKITRKLVSELAETVRQAQKQAAVVRA